MIAPDVVEIGCEYPVTCILDHGNWLPVFPTPHSDFEPEFFAAEPREHFHYDRRFINESHEAVKSLGQPMEVRPMTCLRDTHLPPQHIIWMHLALLKHFEGHRIKGHVCPHKGMPIINGVCAGHGLKWNANGYLKHRGPFKLRWGPNIGEIKNLIQVEIPVTVAYTGPLILDIIDGEGELVFTHVNKGGPGFGTGQFRCLRPASANLKPLAALFDSPTRCTWPRRRRVADRYPLRFLGGPGAASERNGS